MRIYGIRCRSIKSYPDVDSTDMLLEDVGLFRSVTGVLQAKDRLDAALDRDLLDKRRDAAVQWEERPDWESTLNFEDYFDKYFGYQFAVEYVIVGLDLNH